MSKAFHSDPYTPDIRDAAHALFEEEDFFYRTTVNRYVPPADPGIREPR